MLKRRRQEPEPDGLSPNLETLLLRGWGESTWPESERDVTDRTWLWAFTERELDRLWQQHRPRLIAEAARRGIDTPWAMDVFEHNRAPWLEPLSALRKLGDL